MKRIFTALLLLIEISVIAQPKIYTPTLLSPNNGATNQMPDVTLSWSAVTGLGVIQYKLEIDDDQNFTSPEVFYTEFLTGYNMSNLHYGVKYYWRVKAYDLATGDSSYWSAIRNFTVFSKVDNKKPDNKSKEITPVATLEWKDRLGPNLVTGNTFFNYMLDTVQGFDSPIAYSGIVSGSVYKTTTPKLRFGTRYFWRVRAINEEDTSAWSDTWYFRTLDTIVLKAPANNATNQQIDLTLSWNAANGVTKYDYEISTNPEFEEPLHFVTDKTSATPTGITFGGQYYWRVRGRHTEDTSSWGASRSFTVIPYPILKSPANGDTNVNTQPLFSWEPMTGIDAYQLQYDTDPNFLDGFISPAIGDSLSSYRCPYILEKNTVYYWRMRVTANSDTSQWSPAFSFTTSRGIGMIENDFDKINIYPIPAKNFLNVRFPSSVSGQTTIQLIDLVGQKIIELSVNISTQDLYRINVSHLKSGIYILRISNHGNTFVRKVSIDR
ncbi:MAG: Protease-associated PA [Bacteroidetes bacterium 38_7]|nr:MAG: Protease-associated PA [Bacteroidetes bacterium 38_7]HAL64016.1 hypothetical protein [Bacteroidales bacterium]